MGGDAGGGGDSARARGASAGQTLAGMQTVPAWQTWPVRAQAAKSLQQSLPASAVSPSANASATMASPAMAQGIVQEPVLAMACHGRVSKSKMAIQWRMDGC
jgi:hypothetical protein